MASTLAMLSMLLATVAEARQCSNLTIPVDISSRQAIFNKVPVESNLDAGAFATRYNQYQKNYTATLLQGYQTLKGSYKISATYCTPDSGSSGKIQLLSHGIAFDKSYWDLNYNNYNYSYVNTAIDAGYSTLAIDRLGIGLSSHGDPFNEIQAHAEVEALNEVTKKLRAGSISEIDQAYSKVIHVGHSFGSIQSYWLSALYPTNTDGVILTGFSGASMFLPYIVAGLNLHSARLNQPFRFGNQSNAAVKELTQKYNVDKDVVPALTKLRQQGGLTLTQQEVFGIVAETEIGDAITGYNTSATPLDYPSGYFASADLTNMQYVFLWPGNFDLGLAVVGEQTKQPVTAGELLTIGSAPMMSPTKAPVFVFTGEYDVPFCGGNCFGVIPNTNLANIPAGLALAFPNTAKFEAYVQPNTGHGLTLHYNATAGYQVIQNFLKSNGL